MFMRKRSTKQGVTLVEAMVGAVIVAVVSLGALYAYAESRISVIHEWHEQNALYLAEREVESWQGATYNGLSGWELGDVGPSNFLPFGYAFSSPDPDWGTGYKEIPLEGFNYRARARMLFNSSAPSGTPTDFWIQEDWDNGSGNVSYRYREIQVVIQWGAFSGNDADKNLTLITRIAR